MKQWIVFSTTVLLSFMLASSAPADEIGDVKKELEAQKKKTAELEARLIQMEAKQRLDKKNVDKKIEEVAEQQKGPAKVPAARPTDFTLFWKEGLRFETADGAFKGKIGGRIQNDWSWVSEDDAIKANVGEQADGTEFRRARFYSEGLIYGNTEYKLQFDFAGGDATLKDAYLGLLDFPVGKLRFGHFKEPFGLEELTSSKYITFLERASVFAPSRNAGVMLHGTALAHSDPRMTWAAGIFRDTDDYGEVQDDGGYNFTGRVTWLPWYKDSGASLVHLGAAYSRRNPNGDTARYRARPKAHLTDRFVDTKDFATDAIDLVGLECAWVNGPLSLQGEYAFSHAHVGSSEDFKGYYVQGSYFLTGEHRAYKPSAGAFSRVKPKKNFGFDGGGPGAWEIAARYSGLDLNGGNIRGGELRDVTVGLNWHLNPNMRLMWNYIHAEKDDVGRADMLLMRLQVDF